MPRWSPCFCNWMRWISMGLGQFSRCTGTTLVIECRPHGERVRSSHGGGRAAGIQPPGTPPALTDTKRPLAVASLLRPGTVGNRANVAITKGSEGHGTGDQRKRPGAPQEIGGPALAHCALRVAGGGVHPDPRPARRPDGAPVVARGPSPFRPDRLPFILRTHSAAYPPGQASAHARIPLDAALGCRSYPRGALRHPAGTAAAGLGLEQRPGQAGAFPRTVLARPRRRR